MEINLTPRGAMTPEGCERIARAGDRLHDATAECAQALRDLLDAFRESGPGLMASLEAAGIESDDATSLAAAAAAAVSRWGATSQAFVFAVSGR